MLTLTLTPEEARDLAEALTARLGSMLDELVHTDQRDYKAELRLRYDRLERVQQRLTSAQSFAA